MKRFIGLISSLILVITLMAMGNSCFAVDREIRIGVLAFRPIEITKKQWQPTADYLTSHIPGYHFTVIPMNYKDLDLAVNRRQFDFVFTNPEHYVTIREDHGLKAIATIMPIIEGHPESTFGGVIFARADRHDIQSLVDVKGKIVSTPAQQSLGGYSMQMWMLLKNDIFKSDFAQIRFTGMPHDLVVEEVLAGKADVGFVRTGIIEGMVKEGKIHADQVNVLNKLSSEKFPQLLSTDLYPEWPFSAELDAPPDLIKLVTIALYNILPESIAAKTGNYYGFSSPGDYASIESLMQRLGAIPERAHEFELKDIVRKYSIQLSIVSLLIILTMISTAVYLAKINKKIKGVSKEREQFSEQLEILNHKLAETNSKLEASNQNLEEQVKERTRQYQESESQAIQAVTELQLQKLALDEHAIVSITDVAGKMTYVNDKFCKISQYSKEELLGQDHDLVNSGYHPKGFFKEMYTAISHGNIWHHEVCNKAKDGSLYWVEMTIVPFKNTWGKIYQYIAIRTDITARKKSELEIQNLAFNDPLTGLANRRMFMERLNDSLTSDVLNEKHGAIMFVDLDNFKILNDTKGHNIGDQLLIEVGRRIKNCVREGDTVARLGGDEFVILVENLSAIHEEAYAIVDRLSRKILNETTQPYLLNGIEHYSSSSMGVTMFCDSSLAIDELLKRADTAMYQAKKAGRNAIRFYDPHSQALLESRSNMEYELRHALRNSEMQLYYQVQVNESFIPVGAEALLRWDNPKLGKVSPAEFIPLSEESGLIVPIGEWVLHTACAQLKKWESNPLTSSLELAVNVSIRQFKEPDFVSRTKMIIEQSDINPIRLKLEITESMIMENVETTIAVITELKLLGIKFSMDDFGTGYSSLSNIKRIPLDQLKIDQSFVREISINTHDRSIVRTIIAMAQSLNLEIIAEGVETEEQRNLLFNKGCHDFQGYLFGKPMPIDQFELLLK